MHKNQHRQDDKCIQGDFFFTFQAPHGEAKPSCGVPVACPRPPKPAPPVRKTEVGKLMIGSRGANPHFICLRW